MKKLNKNLLFVLLFGFLLSFVSCVEDDDFDTPQFEQTPPEIEGTIISLSTLEGALAQSDNMQSPFTFEETNTYAEAYVVSSDESGNFFRELIVQDQPENPSFGIAIQLNASPLFTKFEFGRKIYIQLDGLSVGRRIGNAPMLGIKDGTDVGLIPEAFLDEVLIRDTLVADIVPQPLQLSELSFAQVNTYSELTDVQFSSQYFFPDRTTSYASEPFDEFDGERVLESCLSPFELIFSTSSFADFKGLSLPPGSGSIKGILTRDFFGEFFTFYINTPEDVDMVGERCDPLVFSCGLASTPATNVLIDVDFEDQNTNSPVNIAGWTNFVETGTQPWEAFESNSANSSLGISARVGSQNSGDDNTISWLITPELSIESNSRITFEFKTSNSFSDASILEVLYSSNWDGTEEGVTTADWGDVTDASIVSDDQFFGDWVSSGLIDMSCFDGDGYIAFKYTGSGDENKDGTYELDDILISVE
jgi:hypothetical protein